MTIVLIIILVVVVRCTTTTTTTTTVITSSTVSSTIQVAERHQHRRSNVDIIPSCNSKFQNVNPEMKRMGQTLDLMDAHTQQQQQQQTPMVNGNVYGRNETATESKLKASLATQSPFELIQTLFQLQKELNALFQFQHPILLLLPCRHPHPHQHRCRTPITLSIMPSIIHSIRHPSYHPSFHSYE